MKFRLIEGGNHSEGEKLFTKGDIVESSSDLVTLFPNKFKRISKKSARPQSGIDPDTDTDEEEEKQAPETPQDARGIDVTEKYPIAVEEGLCVFRRGSWFHVYEGDETTPVNEKALKRRRVEEFIESYLEE